MTIQLTESMEERLRDLALRQGLDISTLVEEAIQEYLDAAAITDLEDSGAAETQVELLGELRGVPGWTGGRE
jgi:predicted DNA-binding protein